jgi:predicted transposase YbfD/YdcC
MSGCVVTVDAPGTQIAIAQQILKAGADYILPVKENQGTLYEDIGLLFDGFEAEEYADVQLRREGNLSNEKTTRIGRLLAQIFTQGRLFRRWFGGAARRGVCVPSADV